MRKITKNPELIIYQENLDHSVLSGLGASLASITPDQKRIPRKNKINDSPAVSILRKGPIPETVNPRKTSQGFSTMLPKK